MRAIYEPSVREVHTDSEFISILEQVLEELYDDHIALTSNTSHSPRIVPSDTDIWAEWRSGEAVIAAVRPGFPAATSGLVPGMRIIAFNGIKIRDAVSARLGRSLSHIDLHAENWALRKVVAGHRGETRVFTVEDRLSSRDPLHVSVAPEGFDIALQAHHKSDLKWSTMEDRFGYVAMGPSLDDQAVFRFDEALRAFRQTDGLLIDLRRVGGGHTGGVEGVAGRLLRRRRVYQRTEPRRGEIFLSRVYPRVDWHLAHPAAGWLNAIASSVFPWGTWSYDAPVVLLVHPWTGSAGEGLAISLEALERTVVVGTPMAGLDGSVFNDRLPNTKIGFQISKQKVLNGTIAGQTGQFVGSFAA